jgi:peroxiredoxin
MNKILFFSLLFSAIHFVSAADLTGQKAPLFSGKDTKDNEIKLADYRGKIVLLDFWASWCAPCQQEFPFLIGLYNEFKKEDFIVLAINIDDKKENMMNFLLKKYGTNTFPVIFDQEKKIPPLYDLQAMPTSLFIDKEGTVRYVHNGFNETSAKEFKKELIALLHEKKE